MSGRPTVAEGIGMKSQFVDLKLELLSHKASEFTADDNVFNIKIKSPTPVRTTYNLFWYDQGQERSVPNGVLTQIDGDVIKFKMALPHLGWYKLNIFATSEGTKGSLPCVFTYLFELTGIRKNAHPFPKQFADWTSGCHLYKPKYLDVDKDLSEVHFKVKVPHAKKVAVKARDEWTHLHKCGDMWEGDVHLEQYRKKDVSVNLNACTGSDETSFATLLQYTI